MKTKPKKLSGIALLLTLSLMSVVLFIVTQNFEKASAELKLEQNEQAQFDSDRAKFALIKLFINGLQLAGPNKFAFFLHKAIPDNNSELPLSPDLSDITVSGISIRSIDHYFYINRTNFNFDNDTVRGQIQIFKNVFASVASKDSQFQLNQMNSFIGALNDWLNSDPTLTTHNFLIGQKNYPDAGLLKTPKGAPLDYLTELFALPGFRALGLAATDASLYDLPIRILKPTSIQPCDIGPLNLNMLPQSRDDQNNLLLEYMGWAQSVNLTDCGYAELSQVKTRLLTQILDELQSQEMPPFTIPLSDDTNWNKMMDQLGVADIKSRLVGFFSARSNLIEVRFTLKSGGYKVNYLVHFVLEYSDNKAEMPDNITVAEILTI